MHMHLTSVRELAKSWQFKNRCRNRTGYWYNVLIPKFLNSRSNKRRQAGSQSTLLVHRARRFRHLIPKGRPYGSHKRYRVRLVESAALDDQKRRIGARQLCCWRELCGVWRVSNFYIQTCHFARGVMEVPDDAESGKECCMWRPEKYLHQSTQIILWSESLFGHSMLQGKVWGGKLYWTINQTMSVASIDILLNLCS